MLPAQRNKIDISKLNPQEQQLFAKYGKLPTHKNALMKMQKERKYFDSGDYAMSKAGVAPPTNVGTAIPNPENIPHASPSPGGNGHSNHQGLSISPTGSTSPVKESALAHDENPNVPQDDQNQDDPTVSTEPTAATDSAEVAEALSSTTTIELKDPHKLSE
ncbi:camp-regulated phospho protein/endosulfine conserved region-domain-containing protein [Crucibulum laeve]|uniref:mRNA stability protein n=1 Tax=Crucibulum laeve TaxID=68775 RepID=A0A5C3M5W5_9AGAR|nr:camp-regulated phospho protein/endosulfine conserved region-domain-containing protein [Crucibulum laeve]